MTDSIRRWERVEEDYEILEREVGTEHWRERNLGRGDTDKGYGLEGARRQVRNYLVHYNAGRPLKEFRIVRRKTTTMGEIEVVPNEPDDVSPA